MDKNKHKLYMAQILILIFKDKDLCNVMAFKGGTSLMFFHQLNRFSTDLDFNLLVPEKLDLVYDKVRAILTRFGTIDDEAKKLYGPVLVLDYGKGERMLKVEISTRSYPNHYETLSLAGTDVRVMTMPDMFAHKLCAMGERLSPRDIFDVCFFLQNHTDINEEIVRMRTGKSVSQYALWCAEHVREASPKLLMQGLGEVLNDTKSKAFVKNKLIEETASALELFSSFPVIAKQD
ncbi:nucleotidyl transferase AbiEii/AbiGii toxin family protein [Prevotella multiformis]|uniref:nucleotidyl transferase AbiEii/AbiGii toxin family protein n=1 Tax=Prevotella multiformis TaxID=282402 RepID=UPI0028DC2CF0|nr:nucleotidyl transferase AbiEii/AbiGii toxin family protein [Prevotella multiformis]